MITNSNILRGLVATIHLLVIQHQCKPLEPMRKQSQDLLQNVLVRAEYVEYSLLVGTSHLLLQMLMLVGSSSMSVCLHPDGWSHLLHSSQQPNTMSKGRTDSTVSYKNKKSIAT